MPLSRGPQLPYQVVVGAVPIQSKWLAIRARIHGSIFVADPPHVVSSFLDLVTDRPACAVLVVNAPIGDLRGALDSVRTVDVCARERLGRHAREYRSSHHGSTLQTTYQDVAKEMSPYRQRIVHEGHPELSFRVLNDNTELRYPPQTVDGLVERRRLLEKRFDNFSELLQLPPEISPRDFFNALALTWTARRVFARAAERLPEDPEWDDDGLRMEIVF